LLRAVVLLPTDTPCTCPNRATSAPSQRIACLTCAIAASPSFAVASIPTASVAFSLSASVMRVLLLTSEFFRPSRETNSARVARWVRCEEPIQATPESGHPYPRSPVIRLCLRMPVPDRDRQSASVVAAARAQVAFSAAYRKFGGALRVTGCFDGFLHYPKPGSYAVSSVAVAFVHSGSPASIGSSALPHSLPVRLGFLRGQVTHRLLGKMDLPVEPDVFHAIAVVDAVDHCRQALHIGLLAGAAARIENNRPGALLGQSPFDLPYQLLALVHIRLR